MSFAVNDFMAKLDNIGSYAKRNRFSVEIKSPDSLQSSVPASTIDFLVKTVSLPARSFGSVNYRYGGKFSLEVPYEMVEEPISITFLGSNDWSARTYWNDWIAHIQNTTSYNMQYYSKFVGTIKISCYDETSADASVPSHTVTLLEAWPKTISAIELGWENSELVDFSVDVAYSWWTATGETGGSSSGSSTSPTTTTGTTLPGT